MRSLYAFKSGFGAAVAVAVALAGILPSGAKALPFQYAPGDIIAVVNKGGTDLIMNLGALPAGTTTKSYAMPTQFSGSLSGATFNGAFRVANFSAYPPVIQFTTTNPLNFPDPNGDFAAGIDAANSSLGAPGTGWFANVATAPDPSISPTNVYNRGPNILALNAAYSLSYTSVIGLGTDAINSAFLNVNTRTLFGAGTSATLPFQSVTYDYNLAGFPIYTHTLLGNITAAQDGSNVALTFAIIPEPGTLLLVISGLTGLGVLGRRKSG